MKRLIATCAIVAVAVLSMVVLLNDEAVVATDPNYTFTYDDYTLIQGTVEGFEGNNSNYLKVNYELKEGEAKIGEYSIVYTKESDNNLTVQLNEGVEVINGNPNHFVDVVGSTTVFIVPPKVVMGDKEYPLALLVGGDKYEIPGVEKLIISTVDTIALSIAPTPDVHNVFKDANDLRSLIIDSKLNLGATNNFIRNCPNLSKLYIKELGTCDGGNIWNMGSTAKMSQVDISFKATNETAFKRIYANTNIPAINVTLLPGSVKANVLNFTNVSTVSVFADDWDNTKTLSDLANDVTGTPELKFYSPISMISSDSTVAQGQYTTMTVSADKLNGVNSLCVTLNYDSSVFDLKSPPVISDSLKEVVEISGNGSKGEYVVACDPTQDITGDLLSFQLVAKTGATLGSYPIICKVRINGSADGNSENTIEHTYEAKTVITVGSLIGDLNADGKVDENDALYLLLYTFDAKGYPIPEGLNVDYNSDGKVNSDDAIWLKRNLGNLEGSLSSGGA